MTRRRIYLVAAVLCGIAPFGFGLLRAMSARGDVRMLWMAVAAALGAALAHMATRGPTRGVRTRAIATFAVGTLFAATTAYSLGATAAAGVWPVSIVLAGCFAAATACAAAARTAAS